MTWIHLHMACSLLSYAGFLLAFVSGMLFLIQERQLKHKRMGWWFHRLPALETLERVNVGSIAMGFLLLTLGVGFGVIGTRQLLGQWWTGDPKAWLTLVLWAVYCGLWLVRIRATLRGRRIALYSVLGFGLVLFSGLGATWWLHSGHPYL